MSSTLSEIKSRWNEVLDTLEKLDRVAWIAYFDARLVSLIGNELTLDFSDADKFSGGHDYTQVRREKFRPALEKVLLEIFNNEIKVRELN